MVKSGSKKKTKGAGKSILNRLTPAKSSYTHPKPIETPNSLLTRATTLLQISQPDEALVNALQALSLLKKSSSDPKATLPALNLIAEINVELGDVVTARDYFLRAVELDPEGLVPEDAAGGAEKFFWLAQLCEEGGMQSVEWYDKGVKVLRRQIGEPEGKRSDESISGLLGEKKTKLSEALCAAAEVYMTDLSWEDDAESRCESLVTEALLVAPDSPEPLQTLASIRISQLRPDDAKAALTRSMELWKDLPPEDAKIPAYPTRISLVRLLLETEMHEEAVEVVERLISEDDQSIEAWYLGGWALYLMGERRRKASKESSTEVDEWKVSWRSSKDWLENALKLYRLLEYEDERLRDHAMELVETLKQEIGDMEIEDSDVDNVDEGDDQEWEDASDDEDQVDKEMADA